MATYTLTAANVVGFGGSNYVAGEEITAGMLVYRDAADGNKLKKCVNSSAAAAAALGIALDHAYTSQPCNVYTGGEVVIWSGGGGPAIGAVFVLSGTAGKMMDAGDLAAGQYVTMLGYMKTATTMVLSILLSGIAKA